MFILRDACRYSLVPHQLGFCGPKKDCAKILLAFIKGKNKNKKQIKKILRQFKAVYSHCQRIAKVYGIKDPLDEKILEIYWLGGVHNYHVWREKPFNKKIKLTERLKKLCQVSVKKIGKNYYTYHWGKRIQKINKRQAENLWLSAE